MLVFPRPAPAVSLLVSAAGHDVGDDVVIKMRQSAGWHGNRGQRHRMIAHNKTTQSGTFMTSRRASLFAETTGQKNGSLSAKLLMSTVHCSITQWYFSLLILFLFLFILIYKTILVNTFRSYSRMFVIVFHCFIVILNYLLFFRRLANAVDNAIDRYILWT